MKAPNIKQLIIILGLFVLVLVSCVAKKRTNVTPNGTATIYKSIVKKGDTSHWRKYRDYLVFFQDTTVCRFSAPVKTKNITDNISEKCSNIVKYVSYDSTERKFGFKVSDIRSDEYLVKLIDQKSLIVFFTIYDNDRKIQLNSDEIYFLVK